MSNIIFPSSLAHRHPFTPIWYKDVKPKPVFWFRAGSLTDRAQFLTDLDVEAGEEVHQFMKDAAFKAGVEALLPDHTDFPRRADERAKLFEYLVTRQSGEALSPADTLIFNDAWDSMVKNWPDLNILTRREAMRNNLRYPLAILHFCIGMENVSDSQGELIEFEADALGRIKESLISRLWIEDMKQAGIFAENLQYGFGMEKNLSRRSPSAAKAKPSPKDTKAPG